MKNQIIVHNIINFSQILYLQEKKNYLYKTVHIILQIFYLQNILF